MRRGQRVERRRLPNIVARGDSQTRRQFNVGWQPAEFSLPNQHKRLPAVIAHDKARRF
jgi:hypothetical protein